MLVLTMGVARAGDDCDDCYVPWWRTEKKNGVTWSYFEDYGEAVIIGASPIGKSLAIPAELGDLPVCAIGDWAFESASRLESVTIPESVYYVSGKSFAGCDKLKTFEVDSANEALKVENNMLMSSGGCTVYRVGATLTSVTIPEGVEYIDDCACDGLTKLATVKIGPSVEMIGDYAFSGCSALKTITVDSRNEYFTVENGLLMTTGGEGGEDLVRASSALTAVDIPEGVSRISSDAFSGIKGLKFVTIPRRVESIGESAFDGCIGLTSVTIPDSVGTIGESAFEDCTKLNTIVIGAGVYRIDDSAFAGCKALKKVVFNGDRPDYDYWDEGWDEDDTNYDDEKNYEYLFEDAPSSCVIFVQKGANWSEYYEIPGTWYGHKIRYSIQIGCAGLEDASFMAGVKGDVDGFYLELPDEVKSVSVKGLPAGMKLTKVTDDGDVYWMISGAPTKAGKFTATISVTTRDGTKDDKSITFTVDAISPMAVGTFKGFVVNDNKKCGTVQFTTTAAGKLSAKVVTASGTYSFAASAWDWVDGSAYGVEMETKKGEHLEIELFHMADLNRQAVRGSFATAEGSEFVLRASRNLLSKTWYFAADAGSDEGEGSVWELHEVYDAKAANLTLSMKGDGTTALKGKLGTIAVNASGLADFGSVEHGGIIAAFAPVVSVRDGKKTMKRVLSIDLALLFSQEYGSYGVAELVDE